MKTLALDPASRTGWALFEGHALAAWGWYDVDRGGALEGDWLCDFRTKFARLLDAHSPDRLAVEDFFFSKRFANGSNLNAYYRAVAYMEASSRGLTYQIVTPSAWFAYVVGTSRGVPKAERKTAAAESLRARFGVDIPDKTKSPVSGRVVATPSDVYDAIGLGLFSVGAPALAPPPPRPAAVGRARRGNA